MAGSNRRYLDACRCRRNGVRQVGALDGSIGVQTSPAGTTFQFALPARIGDRVMEAV
ncbi:MAG: hypothetical protein ACLFWH_00910 [Actinomycetota bacterium]